MMEREQVKEIFKVLKNVYPQFEVTTEKIDVWTRFLQSENPAVVMSNTERYVLENKFPPTISDLVKEKQIIKERYVPGVEETKAYLKAVEDTAKAIGSDPNTKIVRERELAKIREMLGIKRGVKNGE